MNTRYIVKVDELSAEVLENLKNNSRIVHIFSLIDNTIALETENVERIKELKGVKRVYESGKAKLMLRDALNIIGILDVHNRGFYGDGVWIGVIKPQYKLTMIPACILGIHNDATHASKGGWSIWIRCKTQHNLPVDFEIRESCARLFSLVYLLDQFWCDSLKPLLPYFGVTT